MKLASLGPSCNGTRDEFSNPADLERRMRELADTGYNAVICSGLHFHLCFLDRWEMWKKNMTAIVESAHRHGMKVIEHYDVPVIFNFGKGLPYLLEHVDWLQRDVRTDCPSLHAVCLNHPEFRQDYLRRLENFVRATKVDGVMLDECCFADEGLCGCRWCRAKFTADTGCSLPSDDSSPSLFNNDDPLWVTWLKWRVHNVGDWWVDVRRMLNKVNPNISILIYTTHSGFTTNTSMRDGGNDLAEDARACDFLGTEIMSRNVFDCYRPVMAHRKMKTGLGRHFGSPIYGLVYHIDDPNFAYVGWALCQMNGQSTWMSTIEGENMKRYVDWPFQMDSRHAVPVADVGVLFSNYTRSFGRLMSQVSDALGFSETLSDAHLQHDFLIDDDIRLETLRRYKLLVLPSCGCMSAEQVQQIERYVAEGGKLLVSGHTSLYNEDGFGGKNFQLAEVMGVDYEGRVTKGASQIKMRSGARLDYPDGVVKVRARAGAELLSDQLDAKGRAAGPAVVMNRHGKGACLYLAARIATLNYQREMTIHNPWTYAPNQPAAALLVDLVGRLLPEGSALKADQVPDQVVMSLYRQDQDGKRRWLVHMLNATGARLKPGEKIPARKSQPAFPPLAQDLVFDLRIKSPTRAFIVSPDYPDQRPVAIADAGKGYQRITVPKENLQAYSVVYVDE
jgi:hypothetical protein